jgi:Family of unknown function (DUF6088)
MKRHQKKRISIDYQMLKAINALGHGAVFVPTDFLSFGSRQAVDMVLYRLVRKGTIRRLARGIYDFPEEHPKLGKLQPSLEKIAEALVGRDCTRIQPTGAYAANILGLSEQVPARVVFLTDGPSRTVRVGATTIQLRRTTPKNMAMTGRLSGLLVQALRELGKENMTAEKLEHLKRILPLDKRQELLKDIRLVPEWMHLIFRELAKEP